VNVYLMRHAEPVPGHPMNRERQLTELGKRQAAVMAAWLKSEIGRVDIVIASPFARTVETAEIMADALGSHVATTRLLEPDEDGQQDAWDDVMRLAQQSKDILIVGHHPSLNAFAAWLISGGALHFDHGDIAYVVVKIRKGDGHEQVIGHLHWLIDPQLVPQPEEREVLEAALAMIPEWA